MHARNNYPRTVSVQQHRSTTHYVLCGMVAVVLLPAGLCIAIRQQVNRGSETNMLKCAVGLNVGLGSGFMNLKHNPKP